VNETYWDPRPEKKCERCGVTGYVMVEVHRVVTYGGTTLTDGLEKCTACPGQSVTLRGFGK